MKQIIFLAISVLSLNSFAYSNQQCQGVIAFSSSASEDVTLEQKEKCTNVTYEEAEEKLVNLFYNYSSCQLYGQDTRKVKNLETLLASLENSESIEFCETYSLQLEGEVVFSDYLSFTKDDSEKSVLVKLDYIE